MFSSLASDSAMNQTLVTNEMYVVPAAGKVVSILIAAFSLSLLSAFFSQRYMVVTSWRSLPLVGWRMWHQNACFFATFLRVNANAVIFAIYITSWVFIVVSMILRYGVDIDSSWQLCSAAIFLCLACYLIVKLIYLFLIEKAFIVWGGRKSRLQSRLYIFNSFGVLSMIAVVGIFNFLYRITTLTDGKCIIGMQRPVLIPLISLDVAVNVYLTILFLIPLRKLSSFTTEQTPENARLRALVVKTFIGAVASTIAFTVNIIVMAVLNGELGWICLLSCNIDLLCDAFIIQYVTSTNKSQTQTTVQNQNGSVAPQGSAVVYHSTHRTLNGKTVTPGSSQNRSRNGSDKKSDLPQTEEIAMANLSTASTGDNLSRERLTDDRIRERSLDSMDDLERENPTGVPITGRNFN